MKNKYLIVQPHSDDAMLSCASYIFNDDIDVAVLTLEADEKRLKEDSALYDFINIKHDKLENGIIDGYYSEYFKTFGRTAVLNEEDVFNFYLEKIGEKGLVNFCQSINEKLNEYKNRRGYTILFPLGIGHPFHKLVYDMLIDKKGVIFYRDFPHSNKKKAQKQFQECMKSHSKFKESDDKEIHDIKFKIAQKFYKTQSGFFFYEQGHIKKYIPEEFYKLSANEKRIQIRVISKGRPNGKTFDFLNRAKVDYKVVVEPQDKELYISSGHKPENIITLPKNDQGFSYTVNYTKNLYDGVNPVVIMDDDIMNFFYSVPGLEKCSLSMKTEEELRNLFEEMNKEICNTDFEIGTIGKSAFDWRYEDVSPRISGIDSKLRYSCLSVVIIINSPRLLKFDFDESLALKSDIDYSLKCMYMGIKYAKFVHFLQQTKMNKNAKQKGGLVDTYKDTEGIKRTHEILLKRWPDNIVIDEKKKKINGVVELRTKYKLFNPVPSIINEINE